MSNRTGADSRDLLVPYLLVSSSHPHLMIEYVEVMSLRRAGGGSTILVFCEKHTTVKTCSGGR